MAENILIFTVEMYPGGAERVIHDCVAGMDRTCFNPVVAALDGSGEYASRIRALGVEVIDLGVRSRWRLDSVFNLRKILRDKKIRLLHTHMIHASVIGRLASIGLGIPTLATWHIVERRPVGWHFMLDRLTARWCRCEVCVSEAVKDFQMQRTGLPESFFRVVYNGMDLSRFENLPARDSIRDDLRIPRTATVVGALGRMEAQKGFDVLIRAFAKPPLSGADAILMLGGYGSEEEALKKLASELGLSARIIFAGYQKCAEQFLPAADVCAVPSRWEGFGLVVVEAMACGVPVVASGVDSIPEIIRDETEGVLVPAEDESALAAALADLIGDEGKKKALSCNGRQRAMNFSLKSMIDSYEKIYSELLAD